MQIQPSCGLFSVAYLDGAEINPDLAGVFFEIRPSTRGIRCDGAHPDCTDHLTQYEPAERARFFSLAAAAVQNGDPPLFDSEGHQVDRLI